MRVDRTATLNEVIDLHEHETRTLGHDHPAALATLELLADAFSYAEYFSDARGAYKELIDGYTRRFGPRHSSTQRATYALGQVLLDGGDNREARMVFTQLLRAETVVLGPEHPRTQGTRRRIAWTEDQIEGAKIMIDIVTRQLADQPGGYDTVGTRLDLAGWQARAGEYAATTATLEQLVTDCRRTLGTAHTDTKTLEEGLAGWLEHLSSLAARD
jgi:hypothetical protein